MQEYIKVVLADANEEFRTLLQQAVEKAGDFAVVGSCGDGEEALRLAKEKEAQVRALVADIAGHTEYRDEIVAFVKENGGLEEARKQLEGYVEKAVKALDVLPDSYEKSCLVELAYFTAKRIL